MTGSSGFIGGYLKNRLSPNYEIYELKSDLLDSNSVKKELEECNPEFIIHLAARTEVEKSFYEQIKFSEVNYVGTVNMIESAKNLSNLKLFIFSSTMETYGWQHESDLLKTDDSVPVPCFTEETPQNPNAPYAVAKVACEFYLHYAKRAYNFPFTALRQTNTYGRHDNNFFVVEQIITQMLKNKDEINLGYSEPYRNFLYIDDLIDLYETVIDKHESAKGQIFCTGPNNALRIKDLANKIAEKLNWSGTINWNTKPVRPGEIYVLNSSNQKATDLLGWYPKVNLSDGLDRVISIWKEKYRD